MATANYGWLKEYDGSTFFPGTKPAGNSEKPVYIGTNGLPAGIDHTIKSDVPENAEFTDTKVTQKAAITTNGEYPVILANSTATTEETNTVNKTSTLKYNPSTKTLTTDTIDINSLKLNQNVYHFTDASGNIITTINADGVTATNFIGNGRVNYSAHHYTPTANTASALSVDASSTTAATWGTTDLVTGVNIQRDAKGHVTGLTVDSIQMPAKPTFTDTNTTYDLTTTSSTTNGKLNLVAGGSGSGTDIITIKGSGATTVTSDASGNITVNSTNTTYNNATQTAAGLMSANDKKRLDAMTDNADAVSFSRSLNSGTKIGTITINGTGTDLYCETNTDTQLTLHTADECTTYTSDDGALTPAAVKKACTPTLSNSSTQSGISISYKNGIGDSSSTVIQNATQSLPGAMSSNDKTKLDNIEIGTWQPMPCTETTFVGSQVMNGYYTKIGNMVTITFQGYWVIGGTPPWDEMNNGNTFYIDATTLPYRFAAAFISSTTISETRTFYAGGGYVRGLKPMGDDCPFSGFQLTNAGKIFPRISRRVDGKEYPGYMTCDMGDQVWITGSITYITDGAPEWGMEQWDSDM